jgi:succinate-acetate transporter protein
VAVANDDVVSGTGRPQIVLRPITTPVPLTFLGLAIASTIVSGTEVGWVPKTELSLVGWALLGIPAPLQILAAWWSFPARSAGAATGAAVLAGTWLGFGLVLVNGGDASHYPTLGMMLAASCAALLVPAVGELTSGIVPAAVLMLASARFGVSAVFEFTNSTDWKRAAGIVGFVVTAAALYGALAIELEGAFNREVLPILRQGGGVVARHGSLEDQLASIANEPGVRRTL